MTEASECEPADPAAAAPRLDLPHPFYFVRHGQTQWNADGRPQGQLETALSDEGRAQARRLAQVLKPLTIAQIVASPLQRVRDTAEPAAYAKGLRVRYDDGFRECHLGAGQGAEKGPWLKAYWAGRRTPDGAESFAAFCARVRAAFLRAVDRPDVLIVAHGGVWRALLAHVRIEPAFWMANAAPVRVTPAPAGPWAVDSLDPGRDPTAGEPIV